MKDLFDYVFSFLWEQCGWTKAPAIEDYTGVTPTQMRALCQEYPLSFISSNKGYRIAWIAPPVEVRECVQNLLSRAEKITARASALSTHLA